jgi:endonuclease-3
MKTGLLEERADTILHRLQKEYPDVKVALHFSTPLELLVATILSAQCQDRRVNEVTAKLFKKYRGVKEYAGVESAQLEKDIHSTGFYRQKAKSVKNAAVKILHDFAGEVPDTMEGLLSLPGVARKTANIVLTYAFGKVEGIAVDTHVRRLSQRMGFTSHGQPDKIEEDLMEFLPKALWGKVSLLLMEHGRRICLARAPRCSQCLLDDVCPKEGLL